MNWIGLPGARLAGGDGAGVVGADVEQATALSITAKTIAKPSLKLGLSPIG
jgi:hypothetical protein